MLVELTEQEKKPLPYILVEPRHLPPRFPNHINICNDSDVLFVIESVNQSQIVAIDFETKGNDYTSPDFDVVGLGLAWSEGNCYFPWTELSLPYKLHLLRMLTKHSGKIAHNVYFDGGVFQFLLNQHSSEIPKTWVYTKWRACSYALYALVSNESPERKWGLKAAQTEVLLWESSNEHELDEWLVSNCWYSGNRLLTTDPVELRQRYLDGKTKPNKAEMWRAPIGILGQYCILDAESCYLLYTEILAPIVDSYNGLRTYFHEEFMLLIEILIRQKFVGIPIDVEGMRRRESTLQYDIEQTELVFRQHPDVAPHIAELEGIYLEEIIRKEPTKIKKNGEISKNWTKWFHRLESARTGEIPEYRFNSSSGDQLRELFYKRLGMPSRIFTESHLPSTSIKALKHFGEVGKILVERAWLVKELSYVTKYLELTENRNTIHPSFRTPGTVTGRLSSKEPNMQQIAKTKAMMSLFVARPGRVWVDLDFSALEPVVATEFSGDENLRRIYGDGMPPNDIYLFVGASIPGEMGKKIRATGYDPLKPTKETLARAKLECKHERGICKTVVLACQYGAGVKKIAETLEADDIFLDEDEIRLIHSTYWKLVSQLKQFAIELQSEWRGRDGYILNGIGRPMCVPEDYTKDLLNRFIQSTGHDILVKFIRILTDKLDVEGIPWEPIIMDFHDATTVEVPEKDGMRTVQVFQDAMDELNRQLGGSITLRGIPTIGINLAQIKEPEE